MVYVNRAGKAADAAEGGPIEEIVRAGNIVLAVDPRGWGESAYERQSAMRAILVGKPLVGMQTADVLRAFDWLALLANTAEGPP